MGGNAVGIFVHSVDLDSPAYNIGLRCADQILEYNGTDLRDIMGLNSSAHIPSVQGVVTPFYIVSYYIKRVTTYFLVIQ